MTPDWIPQGPWLSRHCRVSEGGAAPTRIHPGEHHTKFCLVRDYKNRKIPN